MGYMRLWDTVECSLARIVKSNSAVGEPIPMLFIAQPSLKFVFRSEECWITFSKWLTYTETFQMAEGFIINKDPNLQC